MEGGFSCSCLPASYAQFNCFENYTHWRQMGEGTPKTYGIRVTYLLEKVLYYTYRNEGRKNLEKRGQ